MRWGHCPYCEMKLEAPSWEELAKVATEHEKVCPSLTTRQPAAQERKPPRLSEVVPKEALEGNLRTIEEVLGALILVRAFTFKDSTFKEDATYLSLDAVVDGEPVVINTGAARVVSAFRALNPEDLPVYAIFEKVTIAGGRRVYRVS